MKIVLQHLFNKGKNKDSTIYVIYKTHVFFIILIFTEHVIVTNTILCKIIIIAIKNNYLMGKLKIKSN